MSQETTPPSSSSAPSTETSATTTNTSNTMTWAKTASTFSPPSVESTSDKVASPIRENSEPKESDQKSPSTPEPKVEEAPQPQVNIWKLRQENAAKQQQQQHQISKQKQQQHNEKKSSKKTSVPSVPTTPERPRSPMPAKIIKTPARSENVLKKKDEPAPVAITGTWPSLAAALENESDAKSSSSAVEATLPTGNGNGKKSWAKMEIDIVFPRPGGSSGHHQHPKKKKGERRPHTKKTKPSASSAPQQQATAEEQVSSVTSPALPTTISHGDGPKPKSSSRSRSHETHEKKSHSHVPQTIPGSESIPVPQLEVTSDVTQTVFLQKDASVVPSGTVDATEVRADDGKNAASSSTTDSSSSIPVAPSSHHHHSHHHPGTRYGHSMRGRAPTGTYRSHRTGPSMGRPGGALSGAPSSRPVHHSNRNQSRVNNGPGGYTPSMAPQGQYYYPMPQYQPYMMPPQPHMAPSMPAYHHPSMYYPMGDPSLLSSPIPTGPVDVSLVEMETIKYWIRCQIEYYFSTENLVRDMYFRSQMNHTDGAVSLSLVLGFNRVKNLMSMALDKTRMDEDSSQQGSTSEAPSSSLPESMSAENASTSAFAIETVTSALDVSEIVELVSRQEGEVLVWAVRRKGDWMRWLLPVVPAPQLDRQTSSQASSYSAASSTSSVEVIQPQTEENVSEEPAQVEVGQSEIQTDSIKEETETKPAQTTVESVQEQQSQAQSAAESTSSSIVSPSSAAEPQSAPASDSETTPQKKKKPESHNSQPMVSYAMVSAAAVAPTKFPTPPLSPPNVSQSQKKVMTPEKQKSTAGQTQQSKVASQSKKSATPSSTGNGSSAANGSVADKVKPVSNDDNDDGWETATRKKSRPHKTQHHRHNNQRKGHDQHSGKSIRNQLFQPSRDEHFRDKTPISLEALWLVIPRDATASLNHSQQEKALVALFESIGADSSIGTVYTPWKEELSVLGLLHSTLSEQDIIQHVNEANPFTLLKYTNAKNQYMKDRKRDTDESKACIDAIYLCWTFLLSSHLNQGSIYKEMRDAAIGDARHKSRFGMECLYHVFACNANPRLRRSPARQASSHKAFFTKLGLGANNNNKKGGASVHHVNDFQYLVREEIFNHQVNDGVSTLATLISMRQDKIPRINVLPDLVDVFAELEEKQKAASPVPAEKASSPVAEQAEVLIR